MRTTNANTTQHIQQWTCSRITVFQLLFLLVVAVNFAAGSVVELTLGSLELIMQSGAPVEQTNPLLRKVLEETVDFLDESFFEQLDSTFQKVSCSIVTYQTSSGAATDTNNSQELQGGGDTPKYYTAKILLTGRATFLSETTITQDRMYKSTVAAFQNEKMDGIFLANLKAANGLAFLSQLETATVTINGHNPLDDDASSYPPPASSSLDTNGKALEIWQIAVVAGSGAFGLVFCLALAFICCMKVDQDDPDYRRYGDTGGKHPRKALAVQTLNTSRVDSSDKTSFGMNECALSCKSPSPARSITSQDSSIFTYNPRSVRSAQTGYSMGGSTYFTSNTAIEMDLAAWQGSAHLAQQPANISSCFGDGIDLSAIEPAPRGTQDHRDLSLIQEEDPLHTSSAASTPVQTPSSNRHVTESALNDLVHMERGMMNHVATAYNIKQDDDDDDASNVFVLKSGGDAEGRQKRGRGSGKRLTAEGQNVMHDLEELSYQIDALRTQQY